MARPKGSKCVPKERCKAIYDMYCVGVLPKDICAYYGLARKTVSAIIRRLRSSNGKSTVRKQGRPKKLSERGMRLFHKYLLANCFDPLHVIVAKFNTYTGLELSERSGRRYVRRLNMNSHIAIQKPFLSAKNLSSRILWARTHRMRTLNQWAQVIFTDES